MAAADALVIVLLVILYLFLPLGLMGILFLLSRRYRGMFDEIGFSRKEMGLLIVGSLSVLLVPADVPILVYKNWFLAANLGGAIIPTVLSVHLLRAKAIPWTSWVPGILAVSLITFFITRVQPEQGIVAEFPYMFLPALSGAGLALILYSRSSPKAPAFAYATATLGSLIGADVFHMPELFQAAEFVGSIGGAGVFDLVYIGGLISFALVLLFATSRLRTLKATLPHAELARERVRQELRHATIALMQGQSQLAAQRALGAVQERTRQLAVAFGVAGPYPDLVSHLLPDPRARATYDVIARSANAAIIDFYSARTTVLQSQLLLDHLQAVERKRYARLGRRAAAFAIDAALMLVLVALLGVVLFAGGERIADVEILVLGVVFWAFTIQVVYFTLFEHFWKGYTPGKRLMGIRVVDLGEGRADFITVFTRNTIRLLDFALLGYLVSAILVAVTKRMQRLGDLIGETVVVRDAHPPQVPAATPIYTNA